MIDVYPERFSDLETMGHETRIDPTANWQFDAVPHLSLRSKTTPTALYPGSKADCWNTLACYGFAPVCSQKYCAKWDSSSQNTMPCESLSFFQNFGENQFFGAHSSSAPGHPTLLIPLVHYKFSGALVNRMMSVTTEKTHYQGSKAYVQIEELLERMQKHNASFACDISQQISVENLIKSGNLIFE